MPNLLTLSSTDRTPGELVRQCGTVEREFGPRTQDSGNLSWLVDTADGLRFVKSAGHHRAPAPGEPAPYLDHAGRVRLLRNAVELARSCDHPAVASLLNVVETPLGPALVYEAALGELVGVPSAQRGEPSSAYRRFANLPAPDLLGLLDTLIDLHVALAEAGWVAADLYDGCLVVDFRALSLTVIDLDTYRRGPSTNDMGRMFGSTRFMAPEEHRLGARIDQRTTVFTLGRIAWHFGTRLTERRADFCGGPSLAAVVERACLPSPSERHPSVAALAREWREAIG